MDEESTQESKALNEQVKLLVKTERRLYGAQRVIEMQLHRLGALTTLAANAGRAGDPDVILELALKALVDVLDVDQAVALVPTQGRRERDSRPMMHAARLRAYRPSLEWPRRRASDRRRAAPVHAALGDDRRGRGRAARCGERVLRARAAPRGAPSGIPAIELVVPLRRKSGLPLGLIVLRKRDVTVSLHETRISAADLPFVELVATRVEADVENVLLYRELEAFAADLEQKVAQRTVELARTNDELALSLRRVRETQAQLVEASKSAALLTLVAGLSHELNNPIGVILGYAQGLLSRAPNPATAHQLAAVERQARRCSELVKAMLGLASNRPMALDSIPPAVLLHGVVTDAGREAADRGVRIYVDTLADDLPSLLISEENVREAFGQLVKNALDATATGGAVSLSARERRRNGTCGVELSVKDSGAGIPRAFLSRVFDPFFTTKPPGKGVGLGLSLVRRSVEAHGGRIDVRSELGHGTTVRVWLPVAVQGAARRTALGCGGYAMSSARGRILVIDDEEDLREMLEFILASEGFEVVTVESGLAAIELARARAFDLAITDMRMPGINGIETLTALKQIDASIEVIVVTGYASEQTAAECMKRGAYGYLTKPFELADLLPLIGGALARRTAAARAHELH